MGAASAAASQEDFIPSDMAGLASHYYDLITGMVRKAGIPDQDVPDSVQYILERLAKTDVIGQFDPEHVNEYDGKKIRTRFSTFLGAKVLLYCRGERGRIGRRAGHEVLAIDSPDSSDGMSALFTAMTAADDYSRLDGGEFVTAVRAQLAKIPPRSARDACDLVALFDEIVHEVAEAGDFTYAGIQERFGISGTTAGSWLARLRTAMSGALGRAAATIGGVPLTADEVAGALKILTDAPGIMVAQPLAKAAHPLVSAEKGWYHEVARAEIRKFPGLAAAPGTHRKPTGNVKAAVMHRLERILVDAGMPVPQPAPVTEPEIPVTREDEFEAAMWRYIHSADEMDRLKALARQAYAVVPA